MKKLFMLLAVALLILTGCTPSSTSGFTKEHVDKIVTAVKEAYGDDYGPSVLIEKEQLEEVYNINMENVEHFFAEGPMFTMSTDMFIVLLAKDGKVAEVEADMKAYQDYLINESFQYPMNMPRVNASQVYVKGNIVAFVVLGKFDDRTEATEEEYLEFAKEQIQIAIDTIEETLK